MKMEFLENVGDSKLFDQAMVAWHEMSAIFPTTHKPSQSESGFFILDDNDDVVSFALLFETEEKEMVISLAWTRVDHRRKGLYRSLWNVSKSLANNRGMTALVAGTHAGNAESIAVHERLGMKPQAIWFEMKIGSI